LFTRGGGDTVAETQRGIPMMKSLTLTLCLLLPMAGFAQDVVAPAADQPVQSSLVPVKAAAVNEATEGARACGMRGKCGGAAGRGKWIVLTGVVGTAITAAAVGIAIGVARSQPGNGQVPR